VDLVLECLHSGFYWSYSKFSTSPRSGEVQLLAVSAVEATKFSSLHTAKILWNTASSWVRCWSDKVLHVIEIRWSKTSSWVGCWYEDNVYPTSNVIATLVTKAGTDDEVKMVVWTGVDVTKFPAPSSTALMLPMNSSARSVVDAMKTSICTIMDVTGNRWCGACSWSWCWRDKNPSTIISANFLAYKTNR